MLQNGYSNKEFNILAKLFKVGTVIALKEPTTNTH